MHQHKQHGLTLIELAITLVIIGLLAGGILVGRDLIYATTMRKVMQEKEQYELALSTFKVTYDATAGDFKDATAFFGATDDGGNAIYNGNNDKTIGDNASPGNCCGNGNERFAVWQHLAMAKLISGIYKPQGRGISYGHSADWNSPSSKAIAGSEWAILRLDSATDAPNSFGTGSSMGGNHALIIGASVDSGMGYWYAPSPNMSANDASYIDIKYDDGIPQTGKITVNAAGYHCCGGSPIWGGNMCTSQPAGLSYIDETSTYPKSNNKYCMLYFKLNLPK